MSQKTKDQFKKIAANRGVKWREKLSAGRMEASLNPSNIAIARRSQGLQQTDLAKKVRLKDSTLGAIERGHRSATVDTAKKIAAALNVPVTKLFKPDGKKFVVIVKKQTL